MPVQPRHADCGCVTGLAVAIAHMPPSSVGVGEDHAHGQPVGAEEITELLVMLTEEFDEDARCAVAGDEGAADEARRLQLEPLATRKRPRPTGAPAATTNSDHVRILRLMENSVMARMTPSRPPWNDMPPCQTAKISSGWAM